MKTEGRAPGQNGFIRNQDDQTCRYLTALSGNTIYHSLPTISPHVYSENL